MIIVRSSDTTEYLPIIARHRDCPSPNSLLLIGTTSQLTVYDTGKNDVNLEACERHNAIVIPYVSNGSTAVSSIGDLGIYFGIQGYHQYWCKYIFAALKLYLQSKGVHVKEENNDLTLYGRKIMGYTEHPDSDYSSGSMFIAMTNSQDLVNEICLKPKVRVTAGLNEFGISVNEIAEVIIEATNNYLAERRSQC